MTGKAPTFSMVTVTSTGSAIISSSIDSDMSSDISSSDISSSIDSSDMSSSSIDSSDISSSDISSSDISSSSIDSSDVASSASAATGSSAASSPSVPQAASTRAAATAGAASLSRRLHLGVLSRGVGVTRSERARNAPDIPLGRVFRGRSPDVPRTDPDAVSRFDSPARATAGSPPVRPAGSGGSCDCCRSRGSATAGRRVPGRRRPRRHPGPRRRAGSPVALM